MLARVIFSLVLICSSHAARAEESISSHSNDWIATFSEPTDRYGHGVLGNTPEWGKLCFSNGVTETCVTLPESRVFEDVAPRIVDVNTDGTPDVVVVESDKQLGAALVVYLLDQTGKLRRVANTPIGTAFRWLAPIGATDLDGDGQIEIAYIDRPHLAKTLRIYRLIDSTLAEVAQQPGLTNHRIGDTFIIGGLRTCSDLPEIITADATWSNVVASTFDGKSITSRPIGPYSSDDDIKSALECVP